MIRPPPRSTLFPYPTLFRSLPSGTEPPYALQLSFGSRRPAAGIQVICRIICRTSYEATASSGGRSEEHTSELQSQSNLVCRLLLEKKKNIIDYHRQDSQSST